MAINTNSVVVGTYSYIVYLLVLAFKANQTFPHTDGLMDVRTSSFGKHACRQTGMSAAANGLVTTLVTTQFSSMMLFELVIIHASLFAIHAFVYRDKTFTSL